MKNLQITFLIYCFVFFANRSNAQNTKPFLCNNGIVITNDSSCNDNAQKEKAKKYCDSTWALLQGKWKGLGIEMLENGVKKFYKATRGETILFNNGETKLYGKDNFDMNLFSHGKGNDVGSTGSNGFTTYLHTAIASPEQCNEMQQIFGTNCFLIKGHSTWRRRGSYNIVQITNNILKIYKLREGIISFEKMK